MKAIALVAFWAMFAINCWAQQAPDSYLITFQPRPDGTPAHAAYTLQLHPEGNGVYRLRFLLHQLEVGTRRANSTGIEYATLHIPGMGTTTEAGMAQVPMLNSLLAVGQGASVTIERLSSTEFPIDENDNLWPAQPPVLRTQNPDSQPFFISPGYFSDTLPAVLELGEEGALRQVNFNELHLQPVMFLSGPNPIYMVTTAAEWRITVSNPAPRIENPSSAFLNQYKSLLINADEILPPTAHRTAAANAGATMLVVLHSDMLADFLPYYEWKRRMGHDLRLSFTDGLGTAPTPAMIQQLVQDEFDAWQPEYVLLVGDVGYIPAASGNSGSLTDHNYACPAGNDFLADLIIARMSVNTPLELQAYITKLMQYEQTLVPGDWHTHSITFGSSDGIDDQHAIDMDYFFTSNGFQSDVFRDSWGYDLRPTALPAIDTGASWLFFIGHGWSEGWGNYQFYYDNGDLLTLHNASKAPVVISIACATADLDYDQGQSFAERWMDLGTDRGAANILAATENCAFFYTDTLGKYAVYRYFDRTARTFGEAMLFGKIEMYNSFPEGTGGTTEATMEQFLILGDPLQLPWTATPTPLVITHNASLFTSATTDSVWVTDAQGQPIADALVCLSNLDSNLQFVARTDSAGLAVLALSALSDSLQLHLTVTAYNHLPGADTVSVSEELTISTNEVANQSLIRVYPNPVTGGSVLFTSPNGIASIRLFDALGREVQTVTPQMSQPAVSVSTLGLAQGVYVYHIRTSMGEVSTGRLVVR